MVKVWILGGVIAAYTQMAMADSPMVNGGERVSSHDRIAKSTVALADDPYYAYHGSHCTGTIISHDTVLTAAHCLPATRILFGVDSQNPVATREVEHSMKHFWYNPSLIQNAHDIALLHFEGGLPAGFQSVYVATRKMVLEKDQLLTVAGFGKDFNAGTNHFLKKNWLKAVSPNWTAKEMWLRQTEDEGVCDGDSGGPAFVDDEKLGLVVVGIATWVGNAACGIFSIFGKVSSYIDWIDEVVERLRLMDDEDKEPQIFSETIST